MSEPELNIWALYITRLAGELTQAEVGDRIGVNQATIGRWLKGTKVPTEAAVAASTAIAFGRNPLEAFVAAGFLSAEEAGRGLDSDSEKLLGELVRRAKRDLVRDAVGSIAHQRLNEMEERGQIISDQTISKVYESVRRELGIDIDSIPIGDFTGRRRRRRLDDAVTKVAARQTADGSPSRGQRNRARLDELGTESQDEA